MANSQEIVEKLDKYIELTKTTHRIAELFGTPTDDIDGNLEYFIWKRSMAITTLIKKEKKKRNYMNLIKI